MDLELNGKTALVTAASRGLGFATARCLALEGANVVLNSRTASGAAAAARTLAAETGASVAPAAGDVAEAATAAHLAAAAEEAFGGLDILVTNSSGPPPGPFESFDDAAWQQAVDLTFLSHVRLIRAALPLLRRSEHPSILTVTSFTIKQPLDNLILSNSVRAATAGLTKSLAIELGPEGIRINSILPGWTATERVDQLMANRAKTRGTDPKTETDALAATIPLRRLAAPEEFARAACFLVSPAASYITGVMLQVDGGIIRSLF